MTEDGTIGDWGVHVGVRPDHRIASIPPVPPPRPPLPVPLSSMAFLPPPATAAVRRIGRRGSSPIGRRHSPPLRAAAAAPPLPPAAAADNGGGAGGGSGGCGPLVTAPAGHLSGRLTRRAVLATPAAAAVGAVAAAVAAAVGHPAAAAAATPTQSAAAPVQAADVVGAAAAAPSSSTSSSPTSPTPPAPGASGAMAQYVGPLSLGYSFAYPTTWSAAKKPIKTHLSEVIVSAPKGSSASVGLVVDGPLKIGSIEEFGTPDVVGAKVLALERKKDSTKDVRLVRTAVEVLGGGPPPAAAAAGAAAAAAAGSGGQPAGLGAGVAYIVEYVVDSSRGVKHYVAKATVAAGQLYVMTATCKEDEYEAARGGLAAVLASLRVAPKV